MNTSVLAIHLEVRLMQDSLAYFLAELPGRTAKTRAQAGCDEYKLGCEMPDRRITRIIDVLKGQKPRWSSTRRKSSLDPSL